MARNEHTYTNQGVPVTRRVQRPRGDDWLCNCCGRLLGRIHGHDVHIRFERRHEYMASLPASATCKGCGTLNRVRAAAAAA
ncbi:hypothetical protein [Pelagovum pacificum]|uniref:Uncharacterized protein n=1 Tax=Pelagovum pacificum TaxID=2588711 RepID=A0A5C5GBX9_9RHOB|nr:hypothetical protein [Pelagovum pacificum]QQA42008.1 hypothetical protein I8N54_14575 [Pelagovum pacificum]TNY31099.1 hypothetical protein FHY64_13755 [Pelagovum pacificum]